MINTANFRSLFAWSLLLVLSAGLDGCHKNDSDAVSPASVEGSWQIVSYTVNPEVDLLGNGQKIADLFVYYSAFLGEDVIKCVKQAKITFNPGGTITTTPVAACAGVNDGPIPDGSSWKLAGTKLTVTNTRSTKIYDTELSGNTLKMAKGESDDFDGDGKLDPVVFTLELIRK